MQHFIEIMLGTFAALIPIVNPFSTSSLFLSLTFLGSDKWRKEQALKGVIYMMLILISFLLFGSFILNFFNLSLPGMRIAGGFLLAHLAFSMLYPKEDATKVKKNLLKKDVAFFPLATPSLAGPGSIALVISMGTLVQNKIDYIGIVAGILLIGVLTFFVLRSASYFKKVFGTSGITVVSKIMGFIIFSIGVQFMINGILEIFVNT